MTETWQSYLKGPRWAVGASTIYDLAYESGCSVASVQEHKGWLRQTVTFTLEGEPERLEIAKRALALAVQNYNG